MAFTPPELFSSLKNQNLDICVVTIKKIFKTLTASFSFQIVLYSFYKKQREVRLYEKSLVVF